MVTAFYNILYDVIEKFVPKHKPTNPQYPPWFNYRLIRMLKEKEKIRKKFKKYKNPRDKLEFELLRQRCDSYLDECYRTYKENIEKNIHKNPRSFWTYIKNKRNNTINIPSNMSSLTSTASNGTEIANLFAKHFSSVYNSNPVTSPNSVTSPNFNFNSATSELNQNVFQSNCLGILHFTTKEVLHQLRKLDSAKGAGPDGIPPVFIKECAKVLALPVTLIFNRSLADGVFPREWKRARVVPVFKKGDRSSVLNYRPISILSCFSKVFESLLTPTLTRHVNSSLSDAQHGFRRGRSIETNLTTFVSDLSSSLDKGIEIDAIYTDFSSAFDKVNHAVLLNKLNLRGIFGSLLDWFTSYLNNRPQVVSVKGYDSMVYYAKSGVPQGSHLGPILFLIFIDDLSQHLKHCKFSMYADDLKIYREISSNLDVKLVQDDINSVVNWCETNGMILNSSKCYHIRFSKKKLPQESTYFINNNTITKVKEIKDLGVTLDYQLKYISHYNNIIKKSAQSMGFIKRNAKDFKKPTTKVILFNALVRSTLEFACIIWNPIYSIHSQRIESIQRSFTRHLAFISPGISHRSPYADRLKHFEIDTLNCRRKILELLFLHKVINNIIDCSSINMNIGLAVPTRIPRRPITKILSTPFCHSNTGLQAPTVRLCNQYNSMNTKIDLDIFNDTAPKFKSKLLDHFRHPLENPPN